VALDLASADAAARLAERLRGHVGLFKVGPVIFTGEGPFLVRYLVAEGDKVFLDLKFHDIPNTVRAAAREAAAAGVAMFNVHATGGRKMMEAARAGAEEGAGNGHGPLILAVTVLTSLGREDLDEIGAGTTPEEQAVRLARLADSPRTRKRLSDRHSRHPPRGRGCKRTEAARDAGSRHPGRSRLPRRRPTHHRSS